VSCTSGEVQVPAAYVNHFTFLNSQPPPSTWVHNARCNTRKSNQLNFTMSVLQVTVAAFRCNETIQWAKTENKNTRQHLSGSFTVKWTQDFNAPSNGRQQKWHYHTNDYCNLVAKAQMLTHCYWSLIGPRGMSFPHLQQIAQGTSPPWIFYGRWGTVRKRLVGWLYLLANF